jgi:hypothetical protein
LRTRRGLTIRATQDTDGKKKITIRPGTAMRADRPKDEFEAVPNDPDKAEIEEVDPLAKKQKGSKGYKKARKQLNKAHPELIIPEDATPEQRIRLIHDAPVHFPSSEGFRVKDQDGWHYYKFNEGAGSEIPFTTDIGESANHRTTRFADKDKNEIIAPVFITLAHEPRPGDCKSPRFGFKSRKNGRLSIGGSLPGCPTRPKAHCTNSSQRRKTIMCCSGSTSIDCSNR